MSGISRAPVPLLPEAGIENPRRLLEVISRTVRYLELDLSGLVILTEAASGPFVVTPVIAAMAGADHVLAFAADSPYGTLEAVRAQTDALLKLARVTSRVEIRPRSLEDFGRADLVTNLGFVRPIDGSAVAALKPTAVVALMCEAWEYRAADVDASACRQRGIPVLGTNESCPAFPIFDSVGWLCVKLLMEAQVPPHLSEIIVVSRDRFGTAIQETLIRCGSRVHLLPTLELGPTVASADAVVIADYEREEIIIGRGGDASAEELARIAPGIAVIQMAGRVDLAGLRQHRLQVYPGLELPARRMAVTLAGLGPRPVVRLHAAGLKVGELALKPNRAAGSAWTALSQSLTESNRCG